jgi:Cof subfamily protein (haloacid dehalogenase superfamily)
MESSKYIIFLDIDGTVFDGESVPEKNVLALKRAREEGHKIFLNTGRAHCIVTDDIIEAVKPDGIISAMGTSIFVGDTPIFSAVMNEADVEYLLKYGDDHDIFTIIESVEKLVSLKGPSFMGQDNFLDRAEDLRKLYPDMRISKISLMSDVDDVDVELFRTKFPLVYKHPNFTEIPPEGCNKATAIKRVCDYYGIDTAHTIAMGDSGNDYDMVKYAGIGVAMGNATDAIKSVADFITVDCAEGGVAYALEKILWS